MGSRLSPGNIAQATFDDATESIRVSIIGSGTPTMPSSVQLTDGIGNITSTVVGSDRALDVNVINGLELTISHIDDSIALGDGTALITSTTVGSKRALDVNIADGSISVNVTPSPAGVTVATYGNTTITPGSTSIVSQYVIPSGNPVYLQKIYLGGDGIGKFTIYKNSNVILIVRLSHTTFYQTIDFATNTAFGIVTSPGDVIKVEAENVSTINCLFDTTIQTMNT